jgi:hypothetical protein
MLDSHFSCIELAVLAAGKHFSDFWTRTPVECPALTNKQGLNCNLSVMPHVLVFRVRKDVMMQCSVNITILTEIPYLTLPLITYERTAI